jgi:hypothetical protein
LLEVTGVVSVNVRENTTDTVDANGLPGHSMHAIVWDGTGASAADADIANTIWQNKPSGAQTVGGHSVQIVDETGATQTVYFDRPAQVPVWMAFTVNLATGATISTVAAAIKLACTRLAQGADPLTGATLDPTTPGILAPGSDVERLVYSAMARLQVPGVAAVTGLALDIHASPTATADLTFSANQIGVLDSSRITVNGI